MVGQLLKLEKYESRVAEGNEKEASEEDYQSKEHQMEEVDETEHAMVEVFQLKVLETTLLLASASTAATPCFALSHPLLLGFIILMLQLRENRLSFSL